MKTGPDTLGTVENESRHAKHESGTRHTPYRRKRDRGRKIMKTGPDALGAAENESGSAKHENGTRRPRYRQK
jgi:hypothetical protein